MIRPIPNPSAALTSEGGKHSQVKAARTKRGEKRFTSEGATALTNEGTIYILVGVSGGGSVCGRGAEPSNSAAQRPETGALGLPSPLNSFLSQKRPDRASEIEAELRRLARSSRNV